MALTNAQRQAAYRERRRAEARVTKPALVVDAAAVSATVEALWRIVDEAHTNRAVLSSVRREYLERLGSLRAMLVAPRPIGGGR